MRRVNLKSKKRRQHSAKYKFQVALETTKETKTVSEISKETDIHPNLIHQWKCQLQKRGPGLFGRDSDRLHRQSEQQEIEHYEQIRGLKMELEWLKKSCRIWLR